MREGTAVRARGGSAEHQDCSIEFRNALRRCAHDDMTTQPGHCWRATTETNVLFGEPGKSDFSTPDFLVYRCLESPYQDIRATDVHIAGVVLSPSDTERDIEAQKAQYASAGIPWYWEVLLGNDRSIAIVRAYALATGHGRLPAGASPLRPSNYVVAGEWPAATTDGITFDFPFPIQIPWKELEF
ncbi:Uma2 family endonuclease [Nocardia wallacei]|uniref:Uma2 family endonuclease n=1 Tax=Nocardia wallacei TaxID=480035 RepID=UPI0024549F5C|nr:Uma2 family endonuclease [Nocardia wallacei]